VATYDGLYPLRLSQACDICDRSIEVIVKEGLMFVLSYFGGVVGFFSSVHTQLTHFRPIIQLASADAYTEPDNDIMSLLLRRKVTVMN
jgi:hypothetical protein